MIVKDKMESLYNEAVAAWFHHSKNSVSYVTWPIFLLFIGSVRFSLKKTLIISVNSCILLYF